MLLSVYIRKRHKSKKKSFSLSHQYIGSLTWEKCQQWDPLDPTIHTIQRLYRPLHSQTPQRSTTNVQEGFHRGGSRILRTGGACSMRSCSMRSNASWVIDKWGPPPILWTDRHEQKHYLPATSLAGGNKRSRGGANSPGGGSPYDFAKFSEKNCQIKKFLVRWGGGVI